MIARAATADALVLVPRGDGELDAGAPVDYLSAVGAGGAAGARPAAGARAAPSTSARTSSRNGPRGPALARVRVRRVAAGGDHRELRGGRGARRGRSTKASG